MGNFEYGVTFESYGNVEIAELLEKLLIMMGCSKVNVKWTKISEEGDSDALRKCYKCIWCEKPIDGLSFGDDRCICQKCRDADNDTKGSKEFEAYKDNLAKKGMKHDDVLGPVKI